MQNSCRGLPEKGFSISLREAERNLCQVDFNPCLGDSRVAIKNIIFAFLESISDGEEDGASTFAGSLSLLKERACQIFEGDRGAVMETATT